ncbi:MAG: gliding motility-associated C-terminal domain-containing protein, partial [Ginsengibacter sp.]
KQKTGKSLGLLHVLERQYDIENGKVQLIRVPYYKNTTINSTLSCLPWDGSKGGVLVLNVENALELNADIDVSAKGFKGGKTSTDSIISCDVTGYIFPNFNESIAALKGEGIHNTNTLLSGKGKLANGGGGGNSSNSGGAGGGNGGMGGMGGNSYVQCNVFDNGGVPGSNLIYSNANNKVFMGGGGGAGQENDFPALGPGGNGGGIIILNCTSIKTNGFSIKSNGETPQHITGSNDDGRSGGGAGGTILLNYSSASGNVAALANGGDGDYCAPPPPNAAVHGPGGGGGGGVIWLKPSTNSGTTLSVNGGINGTNITLGNNPWGATPGKTGVLLNNLKPIIDQTIFIKNIDSVRITSKIHDCRSVDFKGIGYTRNSPINNWSWNFGDGDKDNSQNPTHIYAKSGVYNVKLIGTDINGCKDSILKTITFTDITITKSKDTSVCGSMPIQLFASGGISYSWTPAASLSNASIANPVATPLLSTKYYVLVTNETGCTKKDSVNIKVNNFPDIIKSNDTTICKGSKAFLSVSGGSVYSWSPAGTLNNSSIANPIANPTVPTTYNVKVTNDEGCSKTATIKVDLFPTSTITKSNDTLICKNYSVKLFASGGVSYLWSPASLLNNATSYSPVTSALSSNTIFKVKIIDQYSCVYNDSVKVTVRPEANFAVSPNSSLCINSSIKLSASGGDNYSWSPATFIDNPLINNPTVYPKTTTTFSVIISEKTCGKKDTLFTTVEVLPLPSIVAVSSNDISCALQSTNLSVKGAGTSFSWSPSASLNDPVSPNPIASPKINTVYSVIVKDKNGCINKDSVLVKVSPAKTFFGLPNSFTPNGDGRNDCYGVSAFGPFTELSFSIYNRWGQLVFHTDKADKCWDGTFKGEPQGTGVFAYVIVAKSTCGLINEKGTVTLIR